MYRSEPNDVCIWWKTPIEVQDKDIIVMFSDGVWENLKDEAIFKFVQQNLDETELKDPFRCAEEIATYAQNFAYDLADDPAPTENLHDEPFKDDITVVVA